MATKKSKTTAPKPKAKAKAGPSGSIGFLVLRPRAA
jgi:hypothetical protein